MAGKLAALLLVLCLLTGTALGDAATPTDLPGPSTDPAETEPQDPEDPQDPQNPEQGQGEGQGEEGEGQGEEKNVTPVITLDGAVEDKNHLWHSTLNPEAALVFRWTADGETDRWTVTVTGPQGYSGRDAGTGASWQLPERNLTAGSYTLTLRVFRGDAQVGTGQLRFVLEAGAEEPPADNPGEDTGSGYDVPGDGTGSGYDVPGDDTGSGYDVPEEKPGRPNSSGWGRSGRRGSGSGNMGFSVTPGKALTSQHARGSGTVVLYGTVVPEAPGEPMEALSLGGEPLNITCPGTVFTAAVSGDTLTLTAAAPGRWAVSLAALDTLARSGLDTLVLTGAGGERVLSTGLTLSGAAYARERAQGYVASDFLLLVEEDALRVQVEDRVYDLEDLSVNTGG